MSDVPSLSGASNGLRQAADGSLGPAMKAFLAALVAAAAKAVVQAAGWEFLDPGLSILTALLGAVVFTLAIVLAGVLADFKEAERGLGELVSQVRRLYTDIVHLGADGATVKEMRANLRHFVEMVRQNAQHGFRWRLRDLHSPIDALDRAVERQRPLPTTRTVQVGLANLTRLVDRLEIIVETTFMRAGYTFAGIAIALVLACFTLAPLGDLPVGSLLVGTVAFVLVGLYVLVRDLDNPMAGAVRVSLSQLDKLAAHLKEREQDATATTTVVQAG